MVKVLKTASAKNDAPIWSKIAKYALKSTISRKIINLNRLDVVTKENGVVIHPGKVLGTRFRLRSEIFVGNP